MSTLGSLQRSINLRTCAPDLVFAGIDGLDPIIPVPDGSGRFINFGLTPAFPTVTIIFFGLFTGELKFNLWGPPVVPPFSSGNTIDRPSVETTILALPDLNNRNAGAVQVILTATDFPGPGEDDPQGWGLVAEQGNCTQIMGVAEVGELVPADCPSIQTVSPTTVTVGINNLIEITGSNLDQPFSLVAFDGVDAPFPTAPVPPPPTPTSATFSLDLTGGATAGIGRLVLTPANPSCPVTEIPLVFVSA